LSEIAFAMVAAASKDDSDEDDDEEEDGDRSLDEGSRVAKDDDVYFSWAMI
jgi:hypothetical protein